MELLQVTGLPPERVMRIQSGAVKEVIGVVSEALLVLARAIRRLRFQRAGEILRPLSDVEVEDEEEARAIPLEA
jgi:hypothetical protein